MGGFMDNKKENILREFCYLSIDELRLEIHDAIEKFVVLTKSEEEATRILEKYGKQAYFDFNDWKKTRYYKLMEVSKLKNLVIPNEWYDVDITNDDIIERIIEFRNDEIKLIDEYSYIYDGCFIDEIQVSEELRDFTYLPSDLEIDKLCDFYRGIIEETLDNRKKLVK